MLTILEAIQNWITYERYQETDFSIAAPDVLTTIDYVFPAASTVGRRLWIEAPWLNERFGPFRIASRDDEHTVRIEGVWPAALPTEWVKGEEPTYLLQTEFASQFRRMEFMTIDRSTNPIPNPAGTDMPLFVMGPVVGEHAIRQHSNVQIEIDFLIHMQWQVAGHYLDNLLTLSGLLIDRLSAGRINRSGSSHRPFRLTDDSTGFQRATFGALETRRVVDQTPETQQLRNFRYIGSMDLHAMILRSAA